MTDPTKGPGTAREQIDRAVRLKHPDHEPSDPPVAWPPQSIPGQGSQPSYRYDRHDTPTNLTTNQLLRVATKRFGPWFAVVTVIASIAGYVFTAGKKSEQIAYKSDVGAVASADVEVHKQQEDRLHQIDVRLERIVTLQEEQTKVINEIKADVKEIRNKPGMVITNTGTR